MAKQVTPLEHDEQVALVQWAATVPDLAWLHAIPNGGYRSKRTALQLQAEGLKAGVADLCLPVRRDRHSGLYLELKRRSAPRSALSASQRAFGIHVVNEGFAWGCARGWLEARELLLSYLAGTWDQGAQSALWL